MELEEKAEEVLETLWIHTEEEKKDSFPLDDLGDMKKPIEELIKTGFISISDNRVMLTSKGLPVA